MILPSGSEAVTLVQAVEPALPEKVVGLTEMTGVLLEAQAPDT